MRRDILAALTCAAALACAGQAAAAVMEADIDGNWNNCGCAYEGWTVDLVYNTSLATESAWTDPLGGAGHQLVWTSGSGPSPVSSISGVLYGAPGWAPDSWDPTANGPYPAVPNYSYSFGPLTYFEFDQSTNGLQIIASDGTHNIQIGQYYGGGAEVGCYFTACPIVPFDQAHTFSIDDYTINPSNVGDPYSVMNIGWTYTYDVVVTEISAAPEPASWAMMLAGFFGMGAMLRQRSRQSVAA